MLFWVMNVHTIDQGLELGIQLSAVSGMYRVRPSSLGLIYLLGMLADSLCRKAYVDPTMFYLEC